MASHRDKRKARARAEMAQWLEELDARLRCGLLNLNSTVSTCVMLNLLPTAAAEAPLKSKLTTTLSLVRQWSAGELAISHGTLKELLRSQLQSLSPLMDQSGCTEISELEDEDDGTEIGSDTDSWGNGSRSSINWDEEGESEEGKEEIVLDERLTPGFYLLQLTDVESYAGEASALTTPQIADFLLVKDRAESIEQAIFNLRNAEKVVNILLARAPWLQNGC